jgi:hypothetical protein
MEDLVAQTLADPVVSGIGTAVGLALVALWLAAAWWSYADATRRTDHSLAGFIAAGWILLSTPLLLPLSLGVYVFARPQVAAGDQRVRSLIQELGASAGESRCTTCGVEVGLGWLRCPTCASWVASPCAWCGRWSDRSLELCPWCGGEARDVPFVQDLAPTTVPVAGAVPVFARTLPAVPPALSPATAAAIAAAGELDRADSEDAVDSGDAGAAPRRRPRFAWRAGSPSVPNSQRGDNRRPALMPDGRRLSRSRIARA